MAIEDHERVTTAQRDLPVNQRVDRRDGERSGLLSIVLVVLALLVAALVFYSYTTPSGPVTTPPTTQTAPSTTPAPTTPAPTKTP